MKKNKVRLDQLIFDLGYADSREKAKAVIMSGVVFVNGQRSDKPGNSVDPESRIEVRGNALPFVSRGGYKLDKALKVFPIDPEGLHCIDCGASTGGFTDVLLQHGAERVYAVDVGYGQLAWKLRNDERVVNIERTNLRYVTGEQIPELLDLAVMDVSFISVKLVLPSVKALLKPGADIVCLIKPQFEAGKEEADRQHGVIKDFATHKRVVEEILAFAPGAGLTAVGLDFSPIRGPEGNIEFLCHMKNGVFPAVETDVDAVVGAAHDFFKAPPHNTPAASTG